MGMTVTSNLAISLFSPTAPTRVSKSTIVIVTLKEILILDCHALLASEAKWSDESTD